MSIFPSHSMNQSEQFPLTCEPGRGHG